MATKPSIAMIPSGTKAGTLYSVLPSNGDADFTTTRNTSATRVNKDGLIELVASGVPRLNYPLVDGVVSGCPSYLSEPASTNLYNYSNNSSQWTKSNWTTTDNYAISPDGTQNAFRGVSSSSDGLLYVTATGSSGVNTLSVYVKSNTNTNQKFRFFANGNTTTSDDFIATNEWQRIEWSYTFSSVTAGIKGASNELSDVLFYGFQHEVGSYATSYIPTPTISSGTRSADTAFTDGLQDSINSSEGALYAEIKPLNETGRIAVNDGTTNNNVRFVYNSSLNRIEAILFNGTNQVSFNYVLPTTNTFHKILFKYKVSDFALWVNGFEVLTQPIGSTFSSNILNSLNFDAGNGLVPFRGKVKDIRVYKTALQDSELEYITSYRSFNAMARALQYTII